MATYEDASTIDAFQSKDKAVLKTNHSTSGSIDSQDSKSSNNTRDEDHDDKSDEEVFGEYSEINSKYPVSLEKRKGKKFQSLPLTLPVTRIKI